VISEGKGYREKKPPQLESLRKQYYNPLLEDANSCRQKGTTILTCFKGEAEVFINSFEIKRFKGERNGGGRIKG